MYRMQRIFCATAWELEEERMAFYDLLGKFNESSAMPSGVLYVPVSLIHIHDKRPYQYTVNENIRASSYYLLVPGDDWGPPARAFERDYRLALECAADPSLPMRHVSILLRTQPDGSPSPMAAVLNAAQIEYTSFRTAADFEAKVLTTLTACLAADSAA